MGARQTQSAGQQIAPRLAWPAWVVLLPLAVAAADGGLPVPVADPAADEIIVTGVRPVALPELTRSVTVITAADIARSPATGLAELLAGESNLNLRSVTGNDKFAGIDIRGSGDSYVSNVLVLVDGVRLNPPDLAGPDLSGVALENVERVEIVRGANAVRYGSGAVGGVINIITRQSPRGFSASAGLSAGSFASFGAFAALGMGGEKAAASARMAWQDSAGYRRNGGLDRLDVQLRGDLHLRDDLVVDGGIDLHRDDYGLPGPISGEAFAGSAADRRGTTAPDDGGETRDHRYRAGVALALPVGQSLRFDARFRDRQNDYVLGYTPLLTRAQQADLMREHTTGVELVYALPWQSGSRSGELRAGLDLASTDYRRREDGSTLVGRSRSLSMDLDTAALHLSGNLWLGEHWQASAGYRMDVTSLDSGWQALQESCEYLTIPGIPIPVPVNCRDVWQTSAVRDERWRNPAFQFGLLYHPQENLYFFVDASRSFRVPNADEFALAVADLRPQHAWHLDAGVRAQLQPAIHLTATIFHVSTTDEILYGLDPVSGEGINRNASSRTERRGAEAELRWQLSPKVAVTGNAGYTHARFATTSTRLPLVPDWTAATAFHWTPRPGLTATVTGRYVGRRSDGNDFTGDAGWPRLDAYTVADARLTWQQRRLRWSAGIQNAFDEVAATAAYSSAIYPLASRGFFLEVSATY